MQVTKLDHMGTDLTVANSARVSFGKKKDVFDESDAKIIKFLARESHWSPFGHCSIQFHIKAPIFVARQLGKHQVGLVWNEISRRYVSYEPEFYVPVEWRSKPLNAKQGSSNKKIKIECDITEYNKNCLDMYNYLLKNDVAPEMARMVLPQNMMTEWYWSGSLYAFSRICKLRLEASAQEETQEIAKMISCECEKLFPISWKSLQESSN
jgi:thymidylate synthase (FAD)